MEKSKAIAAAMNNGDRRHCASTIIASLLLAITSTFLALTGVPVHAQSTVPIGEIAAQVDNYDASLRNIELASRNPNLDDKALRTQLNKIPPIDSAADAIVADLSARTTAIDQRLAELGPAPKPGQPPEALEITQERSALLASRLAIDTEARQARVLTVETDQLTARLADRRRALFSEHLWSQSRSIIDPRLWLEFVRAMPVDVARLGNLYSMQTMRLRSAAQGNLSVASWAIAVSIATILLFPGIRTLLRLVDRRVGASGHVSRLTMAIRALWVVIVTTSLPILAGIIVRNTFDASDALTPTIDRAALTMIRVFGFAALIFGLGQALLSADRPQLRLAPIPDGLVNKLRRYPLLIAAAIWLANAVAGLNSAFGLSLATSVVTDALTLLIELAIIGRFLLIIAQNRQLSEVSPSDASIPRSRVPWAIVALASWLGLIWAISAAIIGYLALATFLVREMVWISTVLASLFVLLNVTDNLFPALMEPEHRTGRWFQSAFGLAPSALEQIAILLAGFIRLGLLLLAWTAIVAPFGSSVTDVFGQLGSTDLILHLGPVSISPAAILGGILLFFLGLLLTRAVRGWIERQYLPSTSLDIGVQTSISAGVGYAGAFVALLLACAYLGLSLDRIALLAGALSVGIGFGLQAVIGNFVSGLILLAERPVKVGDWIAIGELEGDVKRINVRATVIEMRDRSRLIVPNSELVTKTVRNVTHGEAIGRIRIVLKVNDGADVIALRDLLLSHLSAHKSVLKRPPPQVFFSDACDGGLEFTCFAYVASARDAYGVRSDLLFTIFPDLRAKGFGLFNSTPIVNVGLSDRPTEPSSPRT